MTGDRKSSRGKRIRAAQAGGVRPGSGQLDGDYARRADAYYERLREERTKNERGRQPITLPRLRFLEEKS